MVKCLPQAAFQVAPSSPRRARSLLGLLLLALSASCTAGESNTPVDSAAPTSVTSPATLPPPTAAATSAVPTGSATAPLYPLPITLVVASATSKAVAATATMDPGNWAELLDMIRLTEPQAGQAVSSPLVIRGEARGTWFFEASFPVTLEDADGVVLGVAIATAQGDWMTEEFVPFEATLTFQVPAGTLAARLILAKDNPSGLPEHDAQLVVPVRLTP